MGRLPFDQIDVLIVGELGKNYSGTGLDPNVIGRQRVETMPDLPRPVITRLAVLDLSVETRGNALGIGLADLTTERLVRAIDPTPMRVNSLTSNFLTRARVPLALPTDRDVIAACLDTCWRTERDAGPAGAHPEHPGADDALGHEAAGRRGRGPSGARLRDRVSSPCPSTPRATSTRSGSSPRACGPGAAASPGHGHVTRPGAGLRPRGQHAPSRRVQAVIVPKRSPFSSQDHRPPCPTRFAPSSSTSTA